MKKQDNIFGIGVSSKQLANETFNNGLFEDEVYKYYSVSLTSAGEKIY